MEPGLFRNLQHLQTIVIRYADKLHKIHHDVFAAFLPALKVIRIKHSGLHYVPSFAKLATKEIIEVIDLEGNRIVRLYSGCVADVSVNQLLLSHNTIEAIDDRVFEGSQIGLLSLHGNRLLTTIDEYAFVGIKSLIELDLSDTSITTLPVDGLATIEVLRLRQTPSLHVFPSVYGFKEIRVAELTYPFHCCAFKFPHKHNPFAFIKHREFIADIEKRYGCSNKSTTTMAPTSFQWLATVVPSLVDQLNFGFNSNPVPDLLMLQEQGVFHPTPASVPTNSQVVAYCGNVSRSFHDVACSPEPDAFNPCEDVMGYVILRVAVWFVLIAALLGNLAVMVVLLSSRFKMTVSKFLMCNLAFADFCMGVYLLLIACIDAHTVGEYFNSAISWQNGIGCRVSGFVTVFASELSIFTLTVITLERWYAITYAIHLNRRLRLKMAAKVMFIGWMYAAVLGAMPLFGISSYSKTSICLPMEIGEDDDFLYLIGLLSINGLAFLLICGCYGRMYFSISGQRTAATNNDLTVAKRMALLVFTDFACWAPIMFFGLTAMAGFPLISVTNSKILLVFFYPLNSCANPFLYAILTKQYRRDLFILLSKYGLCLNRASKYRQQVFHNDYHKRCGGGGSNAMTSSSMAPPHHGGSVVMMTQFTSLEQTSSNKGANGKGAGCNNKSMTINEDVAVIGGGGEVRKLSFVSEEAVSGSRSSSGVHQGSPHPMKNNCTRKRGGDKGVDERVSLTSDSA